MLCRKNEAIFNLFDAQKNLMIEIRLKECNFFATFMRVKLCILVPHSNAVGSSSVLAVLATIYDSAAKPPGGGDSCTHGEE